MQTYHTCKCVCSKRQVASIARASHFWVVQFSPACSSISAGEYVFRTEFKEGAAITSPLLPSLAAFALHVNITCALIRTTLSNSIHASRSAAPALRHAIPVGRLLCTSSRGTGDAAVGQGCISAGNNPPCSFPPTLPLLKVPEQIAPRGAEVPAHQEDSNPSGGRWEGGANWKWN